MENRIAHRTTTSTSTPSTQPALVPATEPLPAIAAAALARLERAFAPRTAKAVTV